MLKTINTNNEVIIIDTEELTLDWNNQFFQYNNEQDLQADVDHIIKYHTI